MKSTSAPRPSAFGLSLFPLQTIFCGLIGLLTLMNATFTAAASTVPSSGIDEVPVNSSELAGAEAEKVDLERKIAEAVALADRLAKERRRADSLRGDVAAAQARKEADDKRSTELADLEEQRTKLEAANADLERRIVERQRQIDDAKRTLAVVAGRTGLRPRYIACTKDGLLLDPDRPEPDRVKISLQDIDSSRALRRLLGDVGSDRTGQWQAVLLVRPASVRAYDAVHAVAQELAVSLGCVAVPNNAPLVFGGPPSTAR